MQSPRNSKRKRGSLDQIELLEKEREALTKPFLKDGQIDFDTLKKNERVKTKFEELNQEIEQLKIQLKKEAEETSPASAPSTSRPLAQRSPPINYIWIGPPGKIAGHDTGGPIAMAKLNHSNPIIFWCLEEFKDVYQEKFKSYKNISVRSVESIIKENKESDSAESQSVLKLNKIYNTCLKEKDRGSIRDRVTLKDAFSIFLLQSIGGYVLDTNVVPIRDEKIILNPRDKIHIPAFKDTDGNLTAVDCWMLYAPKNGTKIAQDIFEEYYDRWDFAEKNRTQETMEEYYDELGSVMIDPFLRAYYKEDISTFEAKSGPGKVYADIAELNLQKTYSNTHKFKLRTKYEPGLFGAKSKEDDTTVSEVFYLAGTGNIPQLKIFIESGGDINERIPKALPGFYEGETPLHLAIRRGQSPSLVKILLEAGADPDMVVKYPKNVSCTARELIMVHKNKEYSEILESHEKAKAQKKSLG